MGCSLLNKCLAATRLLKFEHLLQALKASQMFNVSFFQTTHKAHSQQDDASLCVSRTSVCPHHTHTHTPTPTYISEGSHHQMHACDAYAELFKWKVYPKSETGLKMSMGCRDLAVAENSPNGACTMGFLRSVKEFGTFLLRRAQWWDGASVSPRSLWRGANSCVHRAPFSVFSSPDDALAVAWRGFRRLDGDPLDVFGAS